MIRTPQEFVNEVRARFLERFGDEIEEHGRTVMHFAEENNHLRDLVRRLARVAQDTLDFAEAISGIIPDHPERAKARSEIEAMLREARAALGEDKP